MTRLDQIRDWVAEYELGYYYNPGGIEFFCPAFPDIENVQCSEYISEEEGKYRDDYSFNKLSAWIEKNKENFKRQKPKQYTYYSEGVVTRNL